jgi:hypothetical protein
MPLVDGTVRVDASLKLFLLNHGLDMAGCKAAWVGMWIYVLSFFDHAGGADRCMGVAP